MLLQTLGREDLEVVDADDVTSSKPAPDLLVAAPTRVVDTPRDLVAQL